MYRDLSRPPLVGPYGGTLRAPAGWRVQVVALTGSTNADVAARSRAGEAPGYVLVAEEQSAGRGRLGRGWVSPPRAGLTFSVLLDTAPSGWVPLFAGVAVVRALREVCQLEPVLKWPNDVVLDGAKVCGLLAEVVPVPQRPAGVVVGIGLNVTTTAAELPPDRPATSLRLAGAAVTDRVTILRAILRQLSAPVSPVDYLASCATVGEYVRIELPDGSVAQGIAHSVDADGRLVVDGVAYAAADVTHLRS